MKKEENDNEKMDEEKMPNKFCVSKVLQDNLEDEAEAISKYMDARELIKCSDIEPDTKLRLLAVIDEIVSDELNHEEKLRKASIMVSGILPAEK